MCCRRSGRPVGRSSVHSLRPPLSVLTLVPSPPPPIWLRRMQTKNVNVERAPANSAPSAEVTTNGQVSFLLRRRRNYADRKMVTVRHAHGHCFMAGVPVGFLWWNVDDPSRSSGFRNGVPASNAGGDALCCIQISCKLQRRVLNTHHETQVSVLNARKPHLRQLKIEHQFLKPNHMPITTWVESYYFFKRTLKKFHRPQDRNPGRSSLLTRT